MVRQICSRKVGQQTETNHARKLRATRVMNGGSVWWVKEVVMKLSGVKSMVGKVMTIGLVAGAFALIAATGAQAQQYGQGGQTGSPYYDGGRWDGYDRGRYAREREAMARREAWERHEAREQHERWEHSRGHDRDDDRGYDRDRSNRGYDRNGAQYGYPGPYVTPDGYGGR